MATVTQLSGTIDTVLDTALNSMANNALVLSAEITHQSPNYLEAELELYIAGMGGTPTANTAFVLWILRAIDGTNYEDGGTSVTPARQPDAYFPIRAVSTAQRIRRRVKLPPGNVKYLLKNDGTGQALASSGNLLKVKPVTYQS